MEPCSDTTEHMFDDDFYGKLTGVANALDNVDARRYMDRRCVYYQLPLLETGTMGTKGNTQIVYPHLTESYSSSSDPAERETPSCTLRNFPYVIQHTIQWGREKFSDCFSNAAEITNDYLDDPTKFLKRVKSMNIAQQIEQLRTINRALTDDKPRNFQDCVNWARELFDKWFRNDIVQLLHNFPEEMVSESGIRFWSGTHRCPHSLEYNDNETYSEYAIDFVYAGAILHAQQYGIQEIPRDEVLDLATAYVSNPFQPRSGVKIAVTEGEAAAAQDDEALAGDPDESENMLRLLNISLAGLQMRELKKLVVIDFEKDDDTNHHIEFVAAASNLRAANYSIEPADKMTTKQIAGKIIPALATTTSATTGLTMIELYKMVAPEGRYFRKATLDTFKNGFVNLALPLIAFSEPIAAPKKKYAETEFTLWDCITLRASMKFEEFIVQLETITGTTVSMLSAGNSLLYAFFQKAKRVERADKYLEDVVVEVTKQPIPDHRKAIVLEAIVEAIVEPKNSEEDGDLDLTETEGQNNGVKPPDPEVPYIKYILKSRTNVMANE